MAKYPPTERVTAGKLSPGDTILIRERVSDTLYPADNVREWDRETRAWTNTHKPLDTGRWHVDDVTSHLIHAGRRAVRLYTLSLRSNDAQERQSVRVTFAERLNRLVAS